MFPSLKEMPKCQLCKVCEGKADGFMFKQFVKEDGSTVWLFICGDCYLDARKAALRQSINNT